MGIIGPKRAKYLHDAVYRLNRTYTKLNKSNRYDVKLVGITYEEVVKRINTLQDYYDMVNFLEMSDESINPGATRTVTFNGKRYPAFLVEATKELGEGINKKAYERLMRLNPNWDELEPQQKAARIANTGLMGVHIEDYSPEELMQLFNERFPAVMEKAEIYIQTWNDWGGDPIVPTIIRKLAKENPDRFIRIMESPEEEKEIFFIYPSVELISNKPNERGWVYKHQSPEMTPVNDRQEKAKQFWLDVYSGNRIP